MPDYNGPAVLVTPDGTEHDVRVQVDITPPGTEGPRGGWDGEIRGDATVLWDAFNSTELATLRAGDGTSGQVRIGPAAEGHAQMTGVGAPPAAWL